MSKSSTKQLLGSDYGVSRAGLLFVLAVIGSAVYVGFKVIPFYYNHSEFIGHMHAQARVASEYDDDEIREFLMGKIRRLNIPLENDYDLEIDRNGKFIYMYHSYTQELWVSLGSKDYKLHEFPFVAEVEEEY